MTPLVPRAKLDTVFPELSQHSLAAGPLLLGVLRPRTLFSPISVSEHPPFLSLKPGPMPSPSKNLQQPKLDLVSLSDPSPGFPSGSHARGPLALGSLLNLFHYLTSSIPHFNIVLISGQENEAWKDLKSCHSWEVPEQEMQCSDVNAASSFGAVSPHMALLSVKGW